DGPNAISRIALKVRAGQVDGLTIFEPGPAAAKRTWRVAKGPNAIASATARTTDSWPLLRSLIPTGRFWFIRFAHAALDDITLESAVPLQKEDSPGKRLFIVGEPMAET